MKPQIIFTFPACMGGVASFNFNIINYSSLIKNFNSKVILLQAEEDNRPRFKEHFNVNEELLFFYSYKENQYHVLKRLAKLIGNAEGALVCDNLMSIKASRLFTLQKTIYHLIHDYYYVKQNIIAGDNVDIAIAHSSFFSDCIFCSDPTLYKDRCFFIPYGVKQLLKLPLKIEDKYIRIVFLSRLDEGKGAHLLKEIEDLLIKFNIKTLWTIIGKGPLETRLKKTWGNYTNVEFYSPATTEEVYKLLSLQDILVLPTSFEGTPVSILECLSNAVVPIVSDLPGGIRDIVTDEIGGRVELNNIEMFANKIKELYDNRKLLKTKQQNCFSLANNKYDIAKNADDYFKLFSSYSKLKRSNYSDEINVFSRLDKKYVPNYLVKLARKIL